MKSELQRNRNQWTTVCIPNRRQTQIKSQRNKMIKKTTKFIRNCNWDINTVWAHRSHRAVQSAQQFTHQREKKDGKDEWSTKICISYKQKNNGSVRDFSCLWIWMVAFSFFLFFFSFLLSGFLFHFEWSSFGWKMHHYRVYVKWKKFPFIFFFSFHFEILSECRSSAAESFCLVNRPQLDQTETIRFVAILDVNSPISGHQYFSSIVYHQLYSVFFKLYSVSLIQFKTIHI